MRLIRGKNFQGGRPLNKPESGVLVSLSIRIPTHTAEVLEREAMLEGFKSRSEIACSILTLWVNELETYQKETELHNNTLSKNETPSKTDTSDSE